MAKKGKKNAGTTPAFNLTRKADKKLNEYFRTLKQGILHVCQMHTHDSNPSLSQEDFEIAYIENTLGKTCTAVSLSMKAIIGGLAIQKEQEAALNNPVVETVAADKNLKKESN